MLNVRKKFKKRKDNRGNPAWKPGQSGNPAGRPKGGVGQIRKSLREALEQKPDQPFDNRFPDRTRIEQVHAVLDFWLKKRSATVAMFLYDQYHGMAPRRNPDVENPMNGDLEKIMAAADRVMKENS